MANPTQNAAGKFFIKKELQIRLMAQILVPVILTAVITTGIIAAVYYQKAGNGYFYFMSNDLTQGMQAQNILKTILPSLVIAEIVSVLLGFGLGLFSSRKLALPIHSIEQWLAKIMQGKFGAKIAFKKKEEFVRLSAQCNLISDSLVNIFSHLHAELEMAEKTVADADAKAKISKIIKMLPDINAPTD